jgi:hypothetical protein
MSKKKTELTEIKKVKIRAIRKIIVKFIVVAGLIIVSIITTYLKCCKENVKTHYLKILKVSFTDLSNKDIRISGRINKTNFSYPSTGLVIKPYNNISPQPFPIANEKEEFECYFEVIVMDSLCKEYYFKQASTIVIPDFINSYQNSVELSKREDMVKCKIDFVIY